MGKIASFRPLNQSINKKFKKIYKYSFWLLKMRLRSIRISFTRNSMRRGISEIGLEIDVRNLGLRACAT